MMKLKITLLYLFLFAISIAQAQILPTFGNSRTGGSGMQFLKIAPDARSSAMSGAVVGRCLGHVLESCGNYKY